MTLVNTAVSAASLLQRQGNVADSIPLNNITSLILGFPISINPYDKSKPTNVFATVLVAPIVSKSHSLTYCVFTNMTLQATIMVAAIISKVITFCQI